LLHASPIRSLQEDTVDQQSYTTTVTIDRSPSEVYDAVNDVRGWWSQQVEGRTDEVGAEFRYRGEDDARTVEHLATIRVTELVPGEKVVWRVLDNHMSFIEDQSEWVGTEIRFDLTAVDGGTEVRFTHVGLVPTYECFDVCRAAWGSYVRESLPQLATTGTGSPVPAAAPARA
jgi:uncharacterized protein YndB with AHSA1/START domain